MAVQGNAKAGRLGSGEPNPDAAKENFAAAMARENMSDLAIERGFEAPFSIFGDGQSEAEAQLYAYLNRATGPRQSGFAPYDELSARLNEFPPASRPIQQSLKAAEASAESAPSAPNNSYGSDLAWFDAKFDGLRRLLAPQEDQRSEIASIHSKLEEIIDRVDRLATAMPNEKSMLAVETQLSALTHSLVATREQSSADADRISRAAKEILIATDTVEAARAGFEVAARHTVKELGQTVIVASSRAAVVTAERLAATLGRPAEISGLDRLEEELRSLNSQSRESGERTEAALERVHETLRAFLEGGQARAMVKDDQPPRKRAGLHIPIAADAPAYSRSDATFGAEPARKPQLDTITLRSPPPPDLNLIKALQEADERLATSKKYRSSPETEEIEDADVPPFFRSPSFREEERTLPLLGLGVVAIVLLLASAALYYLHSKTQIVPFHLTVMPQAQSRMVTSDNSSASPRGFRIETATEDGLSRPQPKQFPAMLTAAEQNREQPQSKEDAGEDTQALTNAASQGDRDAQFRIGTRFLSGGAVPGDAVTAARWLARAADQGHAESQFTLASLYERGAGVPKDERHAIYLYRKAAAGGHIRAMHNLGVLLSGRDTAQDYRDAANWFSQAASAGLTDSQYNLALLYERGLGLDEDLEKAYFWYKVAALAGDKEAMEHVERLKRLLPSSETQTAAERARSWRPSVEDIPSGVAKSARG